MKLGKQQQKVLDILRKHPEGISAERMKREYYLTEVNGRISELRGMGFRIERIGWDEHGFAIQQLQEEPKPKSKPVAVYVMVNGEKRVRHVPEEIAGNYERV